MGDVRRLPPKRPLELLPTLPPGGGPFFVLFLAQHSACVRTMNRLKKREIRPREFHDEYLRQLERFWDLDEAGLRVFGLEDAGFSEDLWESFVLARTMYRLTNGGVLLDRDTRP